MCAIASKNALGNVIRCLRQVDASPETSARLECANGTTIPFDSSNREAWAEARTLLLGAAAYRVRYNPPSLSGLAIRQRPMVGFPVVPTASLEFADPALCSWRWYTCASPPTSPSSAASPDCDGGVGAEDGDEWELAAEPPSDADGGAWTEVGDGGSYTPAEGDAGRLLLVRCAPAGRRADGGVEAGPVGYARARMATGPGPTGWAALMGPRFEHGRRARLAARGLLRVVSYNVLADTYATSAFARERLYGYCPSDCLQARLSACRPACGPASPTACRPPLVAARLRSPLVAARLRSPLVAARLRSPLVAARLRVRHAPTCPGCDTPRVERVRLPEDSRRAALPLASPAPASAVHSRRASAVLSAVPGVSRVRRGDCHAAPGGRGGRGGRVGGWGGGGVGE